MNCEAEIVKIKGDILTILELIKNLDSRANDYNDILTRLVQGLQANCPN